jgi:hypothetical protein
VYCSTGTQKKTLQHFQIFLYATSIYKIPSIVSCFCSCPYLLCIDKSITLYLIFISMLVLLIIGPWNKCQSGCAFKYANELCLDMICIEICILHALLISFSLTLSYWFYLVKLTCNEAPHYAVLSVPPLTSC